MMTKCVCACINDGVAEDKNPPAQELVKEEINTNINTGEAHVVPENIHIVKGVVVGSLPKKVVGIIVERPTITTYEIIVPIDFIHGTDLQVICQDNQTYSVSVSEIFFPGDCIQFNIIHDNYKDIIKIIMNDELCKQQIIMNDKFCELKTEFSQVIEQQRLLNDIQREMIYKDFSQSSGSGLGCSSIPFVASSWDDRNVSSHLFTKPR